MTARFTIAALIFAVALTGCRTKTKPAEPAETPEERRAANEAGFRKNIPILDRTLVQTDLDQIHLYLYTAYSSNGKWPKDMAAAKEMMQRDPDMRKLLKKIEEGTYVIMGNIHDGDIIAYCTKETTVGFITVRTNKEMDQYSKEELDKQLARQKR